MFSNAKTALYKAIKKGQKDRVKELLASNKAFDFLNDDTHSALILAIEAQQLDILRLLLADPRCNPNQYSKATGMYPLEYAFRANNKTAISLLRRHGADIDLIPPQSKKLQEYINSYRIRYDFPDTDILHAAMNKLGFDDLKRKNGMCYGLNTVGMAQLITSCPNGNDIKLFHRSIMLFSEYKVEDLVRLMRKVEAIRHMITQLHFTEISRSINVLRLPQLIKLIGYKQMQQLIDPEETLPELRNQDLHATIKLLANNPDILKKLKEEFIQILLAKEVDEVLQRFYSEKGALFLRLSNYLQAIAICHNIEKYKQFLPQDVANSNIKQEINASLPIIQSTQLEKMVIYEHYAHFNAYTVTQLTDYFKCWQQELSRVNLKNAISFFVETPKHALAVVYNPQNTVRPFIIFDHQVNPLDAEHLQDLLSGSTTSRGYIPIQVRVFASLKDGESLQRCIDNLEKNTEWQKLQKFDSSRENQFKCAYELGHVKTTREALASTSLQQYISRNKQTFSACSFVAIAGLIYIYFGSTYINREKNLALGIGLLLLGGILTIFAGKKLINLDQKIIDESQSMQNIKDAVNPNISYYTTGTYAKCITQVSRDKLQDKLDIPHVVRPDIESEEETEIIDADSIIAPCEYANDASFEEQHNPPQFKPFTY